MRKADHITPSNLYQFKKNNFRYLAFNRLKVASEGAIVVLTDYMKNRDNDIIGRQYCSMALGNLAAEPDNHMEIVKSEG